MQFLKSLLIIISVALCHFSITIQANTECVWVTGLVVCNRNQTKVIGSIVELWDLDSPQSTNFRNPIDQDDKVGFSYVEDLNGLFTLEGCASDFDWIPGVFNRPEFYIKIFHTCNSEAGEYKTIMPIFRVYTPKTYDYHIDHPIRLDD